MKNVLCLEIAALPKSAFIGAVITALAWTFSSSSANTAKQITPAEMIQSGLPKDKTLANATKAEIMAAICSSIAKWPNDAPEILRAAAGAHTDLTIEIMQRSIECLRGDAKIQAACDLIGQSVAVAISIKPDEASNIHDLALQLCPDCRTAIENAGTPAEGPNVGAARTNTNPPPGALGSGASVDQRTTVTVCDNGQNVQLPQSRQQTYLAEHAGSRAGACQATPGTNK